MRQPAKTALVAVLLLTAAPVPGLGSDHQPIWPDAAEIELFLKKAKVTSRKKLGTGVTNSEKVTLELGGATRTAVYKKVEESYDSWQYEVAAYEVDKLLGIGRVPPTVQRSLGGRRGSLQLWIEGTTIEKFEGTPPDLDAFRQEVSVMWLFDDLIANIDRHMGNAVVTPDYRLAFIDNSKTFRQHKTLLCDLNRGATGTYARYWLVPYDANRKEYPTHYPQALLDRLRSVTDKELKKAMGPYVWGQMADLVLERRKVILRRLEEMR